MLRTGQILQLGERIEPGRTLTVFLGALTIASPEKIEGEFVRLFSGTIFPLRKVTVPSFGPLLLVGVTQPTAPGKTTTMPNRNITAAEFQVFVEDRIGRVPGMVLAGVKKIVQGEVETEPFFSFSTKAVLGFGAVVLGIGVVGFSAGQIARLVRG